MRLGRKEMDTWYAYALPLPLPALTFARWSLAHVDEISAFQ